MAIRFSSIVCLASVLCLANGGAGHTAEFDGVTLRVGTWGGAWRDLQQQLIVPRLEAKGAKVLFVTGSPPANLAKLIAARGAEPPIDVLEMIDATLPAMQEGAFLGELDLNRIPNVKKLPAGRYDRWKVATWATQEGICYNEQKYRELGIPAPKTYKDLADARLNGRVQFPDIVSGAGFAAIAGISLASGGSLDNIKPGLEAIRSMKALKFWKIGGEAITQLKSGDIYAAVMHAGYCVRAYNEGLPVASAHPIIDANTRGVLKEGWIGIVKGTKNAAAAMAWINEFIDAEFMTQFGTKAGVVPENPDARKQLALDPVTSKMVELDADKINHMLRVDYSKVNVSAWTDEWNRMVAR